MKKKTTKSEQKKTVKPKKVKKKNFKFLQFGKKEEPEPEQYQLSDTLSTLILIHKHNCKILGETQY